MCGRAVQGHGCRNSGKRGVLGRQPSGTAFTGWPGVVSMPKCMLDVCFHRLSLATPRRDAPAEAASNLGVNARQEGTLYRRGHGAGGHTQRVRLAKREPVQVASDNRDGNPSRSGTSPSFTAAARARGSAVARWRQRKRVQLVSFARGRRRRLWAAGSARCPVCARRSSLRAATCQRAPQEARERRAAPGERCINSKQQQECATQRGRVKAGSRYWRVAGGRVKLRLRLGGAAYLGAAPPVGALPPAAPRPQPFPRLPPRLRWSPAAAAPPAAAGACAAPEPELVAPP